MRGVRGDCEYSLNSQNSLLVVEFVRIYGYDLDTNRRIGGAVMDFENEEIEFKSCVTGDLYKEVIAFANTNGGVVYVGIDDEGNAVGLDDVDEEYTRIANGIRDAIMPDVTMFVRFTLQENKVVRIAVSEGANKPYYLKAKGLKPSGVYVRQGSSSVPASPDQIRRMIKDSDGDVFEEMRSMNQNLTFDSAERTFAKYGVAFGADKYRALGVVHNGLYTNLGLILSDQCLHTVKIAVFGDDAKTIFKDNKEFGGSVFEQLEGAFGYLMLCNRTVSEIKGLERVEKQDYPEAALRESLLNALVHRDYSFSGSIIVNVNEKEIEFISLGGLLPGLSPADIRSGISQPRNKALAEVFHRLRLIESYGTGIRRIFGLYAKCPLQPRIEVTPNTFKIVLPNMNYASNTGCYESPRNRDSVVSEKPAPYMSGQMQKVLDFIRANGRITDQEIENLLGLKKTRAFTVAKRMRDMGLIEAVGRGDGKVYVIR